jgi:hypothetical protein
MINLVECQEHGLTAERDGECVRCHPCPIFNLNGSPVSLTILATIATELERWGRVQVVNAALPERPGICAFHLGEAAAKAKEPSA